MIRRIVCKSAQMMGLVHAVSTRSGVRLPFHWDQAGRYTLSAAARLGEPKTREFVQKLLANGTTVQYAASQRIRVIRRFRSIGRRLQDSSRHGPGAPTKRDEILV